ncbi:MAG: EI24 domain-containing protein [Candidatus Delongbacteria bacterium]|nr:EI24 domain-containing protein [Candidatus Delongbacteria bacterium]MBN2835931.1 EI24 domain-containing protein [Candidatus Delongbacteria bacterium]
MFTDLFSFKYIFKGLSFLGQNKSLFKFTIIQVVLGIFIFSLFLFFATVKGIEIFDSMAIGLNQSENWFYNFTYYLLLVPFYLLLYAAGGYITFFFTSIIISPLNTALASKTRFLYTGEKNNEQTGLIRSILSDVKYEAIKFLIFTIIYLVMLLLLLIPVFGSVIFLVVSTLYMIFTLTFEFVELSMDTEKNSAKHRIAILLKRPILVLSFGGACFLIFTIPFLNIVLFPVLVVSGALMYEDKLKKAKI